MLVLHRKQRLPTSVRSRSRSAATRSRAGGALIAAILVVTGIAALSSCLLQISGAMTRRQLQSIDNKRAFYLAEAGLGEALYGLRIGRSGNVGTSELPAKFGKGLFWVEAEELDANHVQLVSTGLCGGGRFSLSLTVQKAGESIAALGIFGDDGLVVQAGGLIDSYDTRLQAAQGAQVPGGGGGGGAGVASTGSQNARVGCNADIQVSGTAAQPTRIEGDVTPGTQGTVLQSPNVTLTGSTAPRDDQVTLPKIEVPALASAGSLLHSSATAKTLAGGEMRFDTVHVGRSAKLILEGPLRLVADSFVLDRGTTLEIDSSGGPVQIYVTDMLRFAANSTLSSLCHKPERVAILIAGDKTIDRDKDGTPEPPAEISCNGRLDATIYAPYAALTFKPGLELFGAVSAKSLLLQPGVKMHFDQALLSSAAGTVGMPKVVTWRVVKLPDEPLVSLRMDPVVALGLQGVNLPVPAKAHKDSALEIEYLDQGGVKQTWSGLESQFDWNVVETVIEVDFN